LFETPVTAPAFATYDVAQQSRSASSRGAPLTTPMPRAQNNEEEIVQRHDCRRRQDAA